MLPQVNGNSTDCLVGATYCFVRNDLNNDSVDERFWSLMPFDASRPQKWASLENHSDFSLITIVKVILRRYLIQKFCSKHLDK